MKIEQDYGKKLDALFDGYKQNSEQLSRIEKEVSKFEKMSIHALTSYDILLPR